MSTSKVRTAGFCRQSQATASDSGSATAWPCGRTVSRRRSGTSISAAPATYVWQATAQPSATSAAASPALLRRSTSPESTRTRQRPQRPWPAQGAGTSSSQRIAASSRLVPAGTSIVSPDGTKVIVASTVPPGVVRVPRHRRPPSFIAGFTRVARARVVRSRPHALQTVLR